MNRDVDKFPKIEYFELDQSTVSLVERERKCGISWLMNAQEKWRLYILAYLVIFVAIVLLVLVAVIVTKSESPEIHPLPVYSLAHDHYEYLPSTADSLLASLNESVDPCDDFYEYACGGWINSNPMPDDVKSYWFWGRYTKLVRLKNKILTDILQSNITENDSRPLTFAKDIFVSCLLQNETEITRANRSRRILPDFWGQLVRTENNLTVSEDQLDKEKACLQNVYTSLGLVVEMEYIKLVITNDTKEKVTEMFGIIQNAFIAQVRSTIGISESTKNSTIAKLQDIILCAVHPDWLYNDTKIESFYEGLDIGEGIYEEKQAKIDVWLLKQTASDVYDFLTSDNVTHECDWNIPYPYEPSVFAQYVGGSNIINIPAAYVSAFYDQNRPASFNYGELGFAIGHEIAHAIYSEEFDAFQNGSTKKCLVDQYESFDLKDEYGNPVKEHINGEQTLQDNYADQIGVVESFKALEEFLAEHPGGFAEERLAGLDKFSTEQHFFLTYANTFCASTRKRDLQDIIVKDVHSPTKFRVLGPLMTFNEFANAWKCPLGSKMNPDPAVTGTGCSGGVYNATVNSQLLKFPRLRH